VIVHLEILVQFLEPSFFSLASAEGRSIRNCRAIIVQFGGERYSGREGKVEL
jgi:hypothetical protein